MLGLGTPEIIGLIVILFLLFGATRLPQLAKSLGQSRKAFKDGMREAEEEEAADRARLASNVPPPQVTAVSDAELEAETRRPTEAKTS